MQARSFKFFTIGLVLFNLAVSLFAADVRTIPLDMYLIIDGSSHIEASKNEAIAWLSGEIIDRYVQNGDRLTIWSAGEQINMIYSDTVSGGSTDAVKEKLKSLDTGAKQADFPAALKAASAKVADNDRISYTLLLSGSASGLAPSVMGNTLRYSRIAQFNGWQALVVAPEIASRVQKAAQSYQGR
jgi:hypothetical protein